MQFLMRYFISYLLLLISIPLFIVHNAIAQEVTASYGPFTPLEELEYRYQRIVEKVRGGELGRAGVMLEELKMRGKEFGYQELSSFALRLQEMAQLVLQKDGKANAAYLLREAVQLAPNDARVLFKNALQYKIIGIEQAAKYFFQAIYKSINSPSIIFSIFVNFLLITLAAITLSLFLVIVVQISKNTPLILAYLSQVLERFGGGLLSPLLMLLLLILPLFAGILACLIVWSFMLARVDSRAKRLMLFTGILAISWGLALPVIETVNNQLSARAVVTLEDVYNRRLGATNINMFAKLVAFTQHKSLPKYLLGAEFLRRGALEQGRQLVQAAGETAELAGPKVVEIASLNQLADFARQNNDYKQALELLEQALAKQNDSFELLYNLSRIHILRLDTEKQREYLNKAKLVDPKRWDLLSRNTDDISGFLPIDLPLRYVYQSFFTPASFLGTSRLATRNIQRVSIERMLVQLSYGLPAIFLLGFIGVLLFIFAIPNESQLRVESVKPSMIWLLIPGGVFFAGDRALKGFVLLAFFFILVMCFLGEPAVFSQIDPTHTIMEKIFGVAILVFLLVSLILGWRNYREGHLDAH